MSFLPDELRLIHALLLNALVILSARRFVRFSGSQSNADVLLLWFLVQYISVGIPGVVGMLDAASISIVSLGSCLVLCLLCRGERQPDVRHPHRMSRSCFWLVIGFLVALIHFQSDSPPLGDDALIYHLPAAVEWLKSGWIHLYTAWFVNPANTYSPLTGSVLMTWWIAPVGCDVLVRFVQMPALLLIFFAMTELLESLAVKRAVAVLFAAATVLCRPFVSQTILVKDDLFLAAFFVCFVSGCARERLQDRLGSWRLGVSLGLMLAMKYTVFLCAPLLLLLVDAPIRAGWGRRRWVILLGVTLLLAVPWYVRNAILTGNPIFPVPVIFGGFELFQGLFHIAGSQELRTFRGLWETFTEKYFGISPLMIVAVLGLWLVSLIWHGRAIWRDPVKRICILGGPVGVLLFVFGSHLNDMRYAYPAMLLFFAAAGVAMGGRMAFPLAGILLMMSVWTAFVEKGIVMTIAGIAAAVMIAAAVESELTRRFGNRARASALAVVCVLAGLWLYVEYPAYLKRCDATASEIWLDRYGARGELWKWARENLPENARLAIASVVMPYPYYGHRYSRSVEYVPGSLPDRYHRWPRGNERLSDDQLRSWVASRLTGTSAGAWMDEVKRGRIDYLVVEFQPGNPSPRELHFAEEAYRAAFQRIYANEQGRIYRVQ